MSKKETMPTTETIGIILVIIGLATMIGVFGYYIFKISFELGLSVVIFTIGLIFAAIGYFLFYYGE